MVQRAAIRLDRKDQEGAAADLAAASPLVPAGSALEPTMAALYEGLGQPAAGLPLLDDWIRLHDDDVGLGPALNQRCWLRGLSNQQIDDAEKDCRKAIRLNGENAVYLGSLGLVELRQGHYADSIKTLEQAIAKSPRHRWAHYGLGLAKIRSGQVDAGNAELAVAHSIDPQVETVLGKYGLTAAGP